MGPVSAARVLHLSQTTQGRQPAKIIPFRKEEPLTKPFSISRGDVPAQENRIVYLRKLVEETTKTKDKGALRRSAEPPSDSWLIAWVVWYCYVKIMSEGGLRVSESSRRAEYHQKTPTGKS